ncbi:glycosyltransferase family 4 protein [Phenylobacterium sp.]|uniref:glycosyltransferase family 4 protein n=1 Tax=Phenylobacterium sp. TaxID=1871053 RepID=UPI002B48FBAD|nr:glycosyltransferase family 4 protein [Phenylobacterium sp.]
MNDVERVGNGIVNAAVDLACEQARNGREVLVASSGGAFVPLLAEQGVRHEQVPLASSPSEVFSAVATLRRIVRVFNPEIIHVHMTRGLMMARLLQPFSRFRTVSTVHNEYEKKAQLMGWADRVIAVSKAVEIAMIGRGVPASKIRTVKNGTVGTPRLGAISEIRGQPLQRPAITTVAGMYERKGIEILIRAFSLAAAKNRRINLYLVGEGADRKRFEALAQQTEYSSRIHFEGFVPDPRTYLLSTDLFVLASLREPFGLVLSEAREAGCAIIASNVDGIPEALDGGGAGVLVPSGDSRALAEAMMRLLDDDEERRALSSRARQGLAAYGLPRVEAETMAVYRELRGP